MANPIAQILSAAPMLRHSCGLVEVARAIEAAVARVVSNGYRTHDLFNPERGKLWKASTSPMGDAIAAAL